MQIVKFKQKLNYEVHSYKYDFVKFVKIIVSFSQHGRGTTTQS